MNPYRALMEKVAAEFSLDPNLVEAVAHQESAFRTDAFRFEPAFYERYLKHLPEYRDAIPRRVSSSYGLLQVLFATARDYGYIGEPEELFQPAVGIKWGCYILSQLIRWADRDLTKALGAYNGGKGGWSRAVPAAYAQDVLRYYKALDNSSKV